MKLQTAFIIQLNSPPYRILMRAASIFPSHGCAIIPVRQLNIFSRSSCLPTTHVMWMNSFVGDAARSSILIVPTLPFLVLAGTGSPPETEAPEEEAISDLAWKKHTMPAWHLITADGQGITLVNIGVGPSNAKTICDHLAVLRPDVWLMIGHCGGLRESQAIGDYVLAHAYLRDDHVLHAVI